MADYYRKLKNYLTDHGCRFVREGKGDHEIWHSPKSGINFCVPSKLPSKHTANEACKQAGLKKRF